MEIKAKCLATDLQYFASITDQDIKNENNLFISNLNELFEIILAAVDEKVQATTLIEEIKENMDKCGENFEKKLQETDEKIKKLDEVISVYIKDSQDTLETKMKRAIEAFERRKIPSSLVFQLEQKNKRNFTLYNSGGRVIKCSVNGKLDMIYGNEKVFSRDKALFQVKIEYMEVGSNIMIGVATKGNLSMQYSYRSVKSCFLHCYDGDVYIHGEKFIILDEAAENF